MISPSLCFLWQKSKMLSLLLPVICITPFCLFIVVCDDCQVFDDPSQPNLPFSPSIFLLFLVASSLEFMSGERHPNSWKQRSNIFSYYKLGWKIPDLAVPIVTELFHYIDATMGNCLVSQCCGNKPPTLFSLYYLWWLDCVIYLCLFC